ncbi:hypothetical protein HanXRQr2_Chr07g0302201 [Helianthus annuus]|uniref:Uncharacterized protein n=1 Tax=Helianthus annuus TaxID=4232 RepID=A0A9K3IMH7_HELAN|nr:hypothetical protein HanXRQr2_Chr07g0302201 [Helianthus annuus]
MATIAKKPDEELWYHRIVKNFVLPRDADLSFQPTASAGELSNLGIGPEKKKRAITTTAAPKKNDVEKAQSSKVKNVGGEKKGMRHSSDSWCDFVEVSDSLEALAPAVIIRRPKPEPKETADIPPSNPDDPIDLESSPEHLVRNKAGKGKQSGAKAEEKPTSPIPTESLPVVNEELPPSPPRASAADLLKNTEVPEGGAEKVVDLGAHRPVDVAVDAEKVISPETMDGAGNPRTPDLTAHVLEKEKTTEEIPVTTSPPKSSGVMPENVEKVTVEEQGSFSGAGKSSPICPEETLGDYYYRTYSEKDASEIHAPVWNLKKGDTFSDWRVCRDWFQGIFPPGEIKFQESHLHEQTYHAYLEEAASHASTTDRIVREWHSMHKDWAAFKVSKKKVADDESRVAQLKAKLEADQAKFEADRKTEEWSVADWKRKAEAEAALLSEERKNWKKICEKDNAEKDAEVEKLKKEKADVEAALEEARSHRERSEQREDQLKKDLELALSEKTETSRRLTESEEKLENSETTRATAESELEPLKSDMAWLKKRGIACVAESMLNSEELDKTVARLVVAAWNDGYAQGYTECSQHVNSALKVD